MTEEDIKSLMKGDKRAYDRLFLDPEYRRKLYLDIRNDFSRSQRDIYRQYASISLPIIGVDTFILALKREVYPTINTSREGYSIEDYYEHKERDYEEKPDVTKSLERRGMAIKPWGEEREYKIGEKVVICIPFHVLRDKQGKVIDRRRNEYMIYTDKGSMWCKAIEIKGV
jgi:hypothetical protein